MKVVPHPLLERDIVGLAEHLLAVSGDAAAARRRIHEAKDLIEAIVAEPGLGTTLAGGRTGRPTLKADRSLAEPNDTARKYISNCATSLIVASYGVGR